MPEMSLHRRARRLRRTTAERAHDPCVVGQTAVGDSGQAYRPPPSRECERPDAAHDPDEERVARRPDDGSMELDVAVEEFLGIVPRGLAVLEDAVELDELLVADALGGQPGARRLEHTAHLEEMEERLVRERDHQLEWLGEQI